MKARTCKVSLSTLGQLFFFFFFPSFISFALGWAVKSSLFPAALCPRCSEGCQVASAGSPEEPSQGFVSGGPATCPGVALPPSLEAATLAVSHTDTDVTWEVKLFYSPGDRHVPM